MKLTDERIKFFKENYHRLSMVELAVELQSNKSSLQLLAKELGLGAKKIIRYPAFKMLPERPVIEDNFRGWF